MDKSQLFNEFNVFLSGFGFKKYGGGWGKICDDYLLFVHLRKSKWAGKYYLDIGAIFDKDNKGNFLKSISNLEFVISAENLVPELNVVILDSALDLEFSDEKKLGDLIVFLKIGLIPYLEKMSTKEGMKELYNDGHLKAAMISIKARRILEIN